MTTGGPSRGQSSHHSAGSTDMPLGEGKSSGNNVDGATTIRRRHRFFRQHPIEKKNPGNIEFERQVAATVFKQEQERAIRRALGCNHLNSSTNNNESAEDCLQVPSNNYPRRFPPALYIQASTLLPPPPSSPPPLTPPPHASEPKQQEAESNSGFLEGTFLKIGSGKQKATRNKGSKNKKKKKGKSRKQSHASEMQSELHTEPSSTVNAVSGDEALPFSSSYVTRDVPLLECSSSSSSQVTELISHVYSASSGNEKELSSSSNEFRSFSTSYYSVSSSSVNDSSTGSNESVAESYTGCNAWNNTNGDDAAGSLSDVRSKLSWSAAVLAGSLGLNEWGGDKNKPNDHKSFSVTISPTTSSSEEGSLCRNDTSHDGEFQKVISRKTTRKLKRIQLLRSSPTPSPTVSASVPISSALVPKAPSEITIGHYIKDDCFSGRKTNHKKGKYKKGQSLGNSVLKTGFTNEENVPGNSMTLFITVHPGNLESNQMALSSTSHDHVALEVIEETCSSGCLPLQGELKALAPADGDAKDTNSRAAFSDKTSSLDQRVNSSCVDWEEQAKKEENKQASSLASHESVLDKIIKAVNNAYQIQAASDDMYMSCGHPVADIETFLRSAIPVIEQIPHTSNSSMQDQPVCVQPYRDQMPGVTLKSMWKWYEEPESFGIEVEIHRNIKCGTTGSEICAYFVPSLSAVQLFGQCSFNTSSNNGVLLFEYFEWEKPFLRPPLFTKIKQLVSGVNLHGNNTIFGDPKQLESVRLCDLHPASWFCIAWYPICQIPSAAGRCHAAFLTYHSLGKLVSQTSSTYMADGLTPIVCPIVGLLSYKDEGEKWFQLGEQPRSKPTSGGTMKKDPAELLSERMRALKHGASAMSKAVVPKATGEAMNYHPDYEFFCSRAP